MAQVGSAARTLTFLFTDVESSTSLWERFPEAMRGALAKHDAILSDAITSVGGQVVKTTGDGFMAAFESSQQALNAGVAAQLHLKRETWPDTGALQVRMGIHSGEASESSRDYHGPTVNRAARIMAAGHGGQILLSSTTAALVQGELPAAWSLLDLGEYRLKGMGRPERVFQVIHPDLFSSSPP